MLRTITRIIAPCIAILFSITPTHADSADDREAIGRVTATFGHATIQSPAGTRDADLHSPVYTDERIITNGGGVTVLLASRTVVKIDVASSVTIVEGEGQTAVLLERGTVHLYVGKRPAGAGPVVLQDALVRAEAERGVFLAHYDPETSGGYYACEHGQLRLTTGNEQRVELAAETQVQLTGGRLSAPGPVDRADFFARKQSLDRLGQSAISRGAETFRVRSRTHDTQVALSQLAAAGWITTVAGGDGSVPAEVAPGADPSDTSGRSGSGRNGGAGDRGDRTNSTTDRVDRQQREQIDPPRNNNQLPRIEIDEPRRDDDPPERAAKDSPLPRVDEIKPPKINIDIDVESRGKGSSKVEKAMQDAPLPRVDDFKPPKVEIDIIDNGKGSGKDKEPKDNPLPRIDDFKAPKIDIDLDDNSGKGGGKHEKPPKIEIDIINDGGKGKGASGKG